MLDAVIAAADSTTMPNDFFTWESLKTFSGATGATSSSATSRAAC